MIIPNSVEELATYVEKGRNVFFFTADWCGDCSFIKPAMPEIEAAHPDYTFIDVDIEWGIMGIPSFVVIEDGKEIGRLVNKLRKTKEEVNAFLTSIKG